MHRYERDPKNDVDYTKRVAEMRHLQEEEARNYVKAHAYARK